MTKEQATEVLEKEKAYMLAHGGDSQFMALDMAIKALEQNNEEIFKQFKKKVFLESEDVLGNEMVDSYMVTDYLAELMGVEND